jgi:hypothetical protein
MSKQDEPGYKTAADGHVYHKSATANATEAPTNEATIKNAAKTGGLSSAEAEFVTILDYEWHLKDGNFDVEVLKDEYGYKKKEWDRLSNSPTVHKALQERGINVKSIAPDSEVAKAAGRAKLTPLQLIVANSMMDLIDTRPPKKKLQDAGVSPYQYQSWLKDPAFKNYMVERSEGLLGDVQHEAMLALVDKVMSGDMKAIEYYHEITGRYIKQTTANTGTNSTHDLQQMIVRIIEIIVDEVDDVNVAARISDRLKGLVMGNQVAGVLAVDAPVVPEIAPPREMTPEIQAAIAKGTGVNS